MSIVANALAYIHPNGEVLFNNLNFSILSGNKVSLVGNNGVGKSTLLRIIAGELNQTQGEILISKQLYYVPQHLRQFDDLTISMALQVNDKISALHSILGGNVSQENFDTLNDDWDIEEKTQKALAYWDIAELSLSKKISSLSGGEKTKVFLAGIQIYSPDIILLDEPSNHLDAQSRRVLYKFIKESNSTILIVSHDRTLLNEVNITMELTPNSIEIYGGNYNFFCQQKEVKMNSLHTLLADKEKNLKQTQQKSREMAEQRQKQESRGHTQKVKAGIPRIAMGRLKDIAEQSTAKIKNEQREKVNDISTEIKAIKQTIQAEQLLKIEITNSGLHKGKILVEAEEVNIMYGDHILWKKPVSFHIYSGDRIQIKGSNGAGKTSLIRLITKEISASTGKLYIAGFKSLYIDQEYSIIENDLSIFEQAQKFNNQYLPEHDIKMLLYRHQFNQSYWNRRCLFLSGGEKMKLLLCALSISNNTPDILILDEPTNNLDIRSKDILTYATKEFKGTIIVISHDIHFIKEIGIDKLITV